MKTQIQNQYPSMAAMSGACGIPLPILKRAKAAGCRAFRASGRVDLPGFLTWFFRQPPPPPPPDTLQEFLNYLETAAATPPPGK